MTFEQKELELIKSFLGSSIQIPVAMARDVVKLMDKIESALTIEPAAEVTPAEVVEAEPVA